MGFVSEFKEFALKGNVVDLAIGVVIGAAFSKIVTSLIDDVITPLLLNPALKAAHVSDIHELHYGSVKYGAFLANIINFLMVAVVLFLVIKGINKMKRKKEAENPPPAELSKTELLLTEIRDQLKK